MSDIKRIDIAEFRALGFVQEINRRVLHPAGLALEVIVEEDGSERLGGVWDYRDDPEGIVFGTPPDAAKRDSVEFLISEHREAREALFGGPTVVQACE